MQRCWFSNADFRPTFHQLKQELSDLLAIATNESDNIYVRNVTQELPYTYYLNEEFMQTSKQYISRNAYVQLMADDGYINDGFRRDSHTLNSRTVITDTNGNTYDITGRKMNGTTAF